MTREQIIAILRIHEYELRRHGVAHAALFGSTARGEAAPGSDIDILIEVEPNLGMSVFDYVALKERIAGLFEGPVDVVQKQGLKPHLRQSVLAEAIDAF